MQPPDREAIDAFIEAALPVPSGHRDGGGDCRSHRAVTITGRCSCRRNPSARFAITISAPPTSGQ